MITQLLSLLGLCFVITLMGVWMLRGLARGLARGDTSDSSTREIERDEVAGVLPAESPFSAAVFCLPLAIAFVVGVFQLREEWAAPTQYWHWLPVAGLLAAVCWTAVSGMGLRTRLFVGFAIAAVSAWLLVPSWPNMEPSRFTHIVLLAGYLFALFLVSNAVSAGGNPRQHLIAIFTTATVLGLSIAGLFSFEYGELSLLVATSCSACLAASFLWQPTRRCTAGLFVVSNLLLGGTAFVSAVYPQPPILEFLLLPLAPATLWFARSSSEDRRPFWLEMLPFAGALALFTIVLVLRHGVN